MGLTGAVAGLVLAVGSGGASDADDPAPHSASDPATFAQVRDGAPEAARVPGRLPPDPVVRVEVPVLGLSVEARPVATREDGVLLPPVGTVGWWEGGASPLADEGTVLVVGHVNTPGGGRGVFGSLDELEAGATIVVTATDGTVRSYVVGEPRTYRATALPDRLFTTSGPHRLALVTCALPYDERLERYTRTTVVWAEPV